MPLISSCFCTQRSAHRVRPSPRIRAPLARDGLFFSRKSVNRHRVPTLIKRSILDAYYSTDVKLSWRVTVQRHPPAAIGRQPALLWRSFCALRTLPWLASRCVPGDSPENVVRRAKGDPLSVILEPRFSLCGPKRTRMFAMIAFEFLRDPD